MPLKVLYSLGTAYLTRSVLELLSLLAASPKVPSKGGRAVVVLSCTAVMHAWPPSCTLVKPARLYPSTRQSVDEKRMVDEGQSLSGCMLLETNDVLCSLVATAVIDWRRSEDSAHVCICCGGHWSVPTVRLDSCQADAVRRSAASKTWRPAVDSCSRMDLILSASSRVQECGYNTRY